MLIWCAYELLNDYQDQDKKKHPSPYIFNFFFEWGENGCDQISTTFKYTTTYH